MFKVMSILKKFIKFYKPYKVLFFADMFCALIVSAVDLSFPLLLSYLSKNFYTKEKVIVLHYIVFIGIAFNNCVCSKVFLSVFYCHLGTHNGCKNGK